MCTFHCNYAILQLQNVNFILQPQGCRNRSSKCRTKRDPGFISTGYTYWKEATSAFKKHQTSSSHREAHEALVLLPQQICGDVEELLSQMHSDQKVKKRDVSKNLRYLSQQGLALRGSHGNIQKAIFSNFFAPRLKIHYSLRHG